MTTTRKKHLIFQKLTEHWQSGCKIGKMTRMPASKERGRKGEIESESYAYFSYIRKF